MSFTQEQLTAIEAAIASGTTRVRYSDREVVYASINEMLRVRDLIRADLGLVGEDGGRTHRYATHSKGFE